MKELTFDIAKGLHGRKVRLYATQSLDWFTKKVEGDIYKIYYSEERNAVYLMKPRARSRGTDLRSLDKPVRYTEV